jgi:hypothetical protein
MLANACRVSCGKREIVTGFCKSYCLEHFKKEGKKKLPGFCCGVSEIFTLLGMLRGIDWYLVTEVSGQPSGSILKD